VEVGQRRQILVADAYPLFALGLRAALMAETELRVTLIGGDPAQLVGAALNCHADVVVAGVVGDANELLHACSRLRRRRPGCRVILLAEPGANLEMSDVVRAGITGLLLRSTAEGDLVAAVRAALAGRSLVAPEVANAMMSALAAAVSRADARSLVGGLSVRELEVLRLVADGLPNRDIAGRLHISENTVKNHMRRVHEKLGVRSRTEAVVHAAREGLLSIAPQQPSGLG